MTAMWMACTTEETVQWNRLEDCSSLEAGDVQDDCFGHFVVDLFKNDPKAGMAVMQKISNPSVRDFLWLEITRKVDPTTTRYCQQIQSKTLLQRCQTLVSRPHLHRETLRNSPPSGDLSTPKSGQ